MAEDAAQPLVAQNHTRGGFWNAYDRTIPEPLVAALEMIVFHVHKCEALFAAYSASVALAC